MNRHTITLALAVCCAVCLYWLGTEPDLPQLVMSDKLPSAPTSDADTTATPDKSDESAAETVDSGEVAHDDQQDVTLAFEPPFPDRTNLFQAPKRQGRGQTRAGGQAESAVELLGFVNVDGQRVALSIDGLVATVGEGEQHNGIEVISIQPPSVFLRRGKQRWQASFEN